MSATTNALPTTRRDAGTGEMEVDRVEFAFGTSRRGFLQTLGAGLMILVSATASGAQVAPPGGGRRGAGGGRGGGGFRGGGAPRPVAARVHIGGDGVITVMTSKVECGQGARAEITQAAAEELHVPATAVRLVMADTSLVPDDGMTAGSGTTPRTIPSVRQGCAAARRLLTDVAAKRWNVDAKTLTVRDGKVTDEAGHTLSYAELAAADDFTTAAGKPPPADVTITPVSEWKVLGIATPRPNGIEIVTGGHHYPSDVTRPGMLHAKILRPPAYGATLSSIDLAPARAMADVVVVQDGAFVGVAARTTYAAELALDAIIKTAKWDRSKEAVTDSDNLYKHLRDKARGGMPANPFADEVAKAAKTLKQTYLVPYVQHAPMEPRAAVAEWADGKLTVWTATQNPFGVKGELVRAFNLADDKVRVIVPDFGGGFGGKHSGECAVECARLAMASAGKPVALRWTRAEEFTFAYFRPAAVIDVEAGLDAEGQLTSWHFVNVNSGPSSIETPYRAGKAKSQFVQSEPPLRHGSYRGLAATANTFGRECAMDELAALAGRDSLDFRLAHLAENPRLRATLEEAAKHFDWTSRVKDKRPGTGVGLACGTEKGSFVATCAEIVLEGDSFKVTHVVQTFECGAVLNPANLRAQNEGSIVMALGPAMREEIRFRDGRVTTDAFSDYHVPRVADLPQIDVHLMDRRDVPAAGAGETPLIAVAPAIANALFQATGARCRQMPLRVSATHL